MTTRTTTRSDARANFLATVLTTAIEGGIGYWSSVEDYEWGYPDLGCSNGEPLPAGAQSYARALIWEDESDDVTPLEVNVETIAKAFGKIREDRLNLLKLGEARSRFLEADRENDGDLDALDADMIVQIGLFGEVVYG